MSDWAKASEIGIVQPQTADEVEALRGDISLLIAQFDNHDDDFVDWAKKHPQILTLIYLGDEPVAFIRLDDSDENPHEIGKKSLEFSGCVRPEYRDKGLTLQVTPFVIADALERTGRKKVLAKVAEDNREAIAALNAIGFKFAGMDAQQRGIKIYRATKEDLIHDDPQE